MRTIYLGLKDVLIEDISESGENERFNGEGKGAFNILKICEEGVD